MGLCEQVSFLLSRLELTMLIDIRSMMLPTIRQAQRAQLYWLLGLVVWSIRLHLLLFLHRVQLPRVPETMLVAASTFWPSDSGFLSVYWLHLDASQFASSAAGASVVAKTRCLHRLTRQPQSCMSVYPKQTLPLVPPLHFSW